MDKPIKTMNNFQVLLYAIIVILLAVIIFLIFQVVDLSNNLKSARDFFKVQQMNTKTIDFTRIFIDKVLKANGEVSFEDRLRLENAVRDIGNKELLDQWTKFTGSKTEQEAQVEVKDLLNLLINNIVY